jgi:hypothetical protein
VVFPGQRTRLIGPATAWSTGPPRQGEGAKVTIWRSSPNYVRCFRRFRKGQVATRRIWNAILGTAFLLYGLYLLISFQGGHYLVFFYVFILPLLMGVRFFRDRSAYRARQQAAVRAPSHGYGQQAGHEQQSPRDPVR